MSESGKRGNPAPDVGKGTEESMHCAGCKFDTILKHEFSQLIGQTADRISNALSIMRGTTCQYLSRNGAELNFKMAQIELNAAVQTINTVTEMFELREDL